MGDDFKVNTRVVRNEDRDWIELIGGTDVRIQIIKGADKISALTTLDHYREYLDHMDGQTWDEYIK